MSKVRLGTKDETLLALSKVLTIAKVMPLVSFSVEEWVKDQKRILAKITKAFPKEIIIVRSAARNEDVSTQSNAGVFLSVSTLTTKKIEGVSEAINRVIASYGTAASDDRILVQEQVMGISMHGVLFTRDIDTLAPYYVVNFDESGSHDGVTSGAGSDLKTWVRFRNSPYPITSPKLSRLISCAEEVMKITECDCLDIEFAFAGKDELFLLQARPIVTTGKSCHATDAQLVDYLSKIERKIKKLDAHHPQICGNRAIFSVMTDWNPAEIIGIRPGMLALSLYKELITDSMWAYQRDNYGYRNLRSFPLMVSFMGCPYIDVRASLNSFIPKTLDEGLAEKLASYYLRKLTASPADHDKVEFKIVYSCYYLSISDRIKSLKNEGFTELEIDRIKYALLNITNGIVNSKNGLYRQDLARVSELDRKFEAIVTSDLSLVDKIYWLIEDCKRYGTLPFAGLARGGFVAVQLLQSMIETGIISEDDNDRFMNSLNTITRRLSRDLAKYSSGEMSEREFLKLYGHLRPGTYDILSRRYDEAFGAYFDRSMIPSTHEEEVPFDFTPDQKKAIGDSLLENGIHATVEEFLTFIREAIEGREYSKFIFTRSLSEVLVLLEELGKKCGVAREDLAHLNIRVLIEMYSRLEPFDLGDSLRDDIERNRASGKLTGALKLPQLIEFPEKIYEFYVGDVEPNYITRGRVTEIVVLEENLLTMDLSKKIVLIRSADPGFDWLFSRKIGGLVTMYGGSNSHMAIRCAELKIPAVIGCGEDNFRHWSSASMLEIDCANKQVRVVA